MRKKMVSTGQKMLLHHTDWKILLKIRFHQTKIAFTLPYFPVHCQMFFLSFVFDLLNQPFSKKFSQIYFIQLMIFQYFRRVSNFRFSKPVSLVHWRGEIGVFYETLVKVQPVVQQLHCIYTSRCHNFCFTKLLTLILINFFSGIFLFYHKKS